MGMGEPMMNFDAVIAACERLPDIGVATSHTTISTVGWMPGIERLAHEGPRVRLALSLHAARRRAALRADAGQRPLPARRRARGLPRLARGAPQARLHRVPDARRRQRPAPSRPARSPALLTPREAFKVNLIPYNPTGGEYEGSSPRGDRGVSRDAGRARRPGDGAPHPRARHRRRLRAARGDRRRRRNAPGRGGR